MGDHNSHQQSPTEVRGEREEKNPGENKETASPTETARESRILLYRERLSVMGQADSVLRLRTHMFSIALVILVVWVMREFYLRAQVIETPPEAALAAAPPTLAPTAEPLNLPPFIMPSGLYVVGIPRFVLTDTSIPTQARTQVITYVVQPGDTVFGIADKFGLTPYTILWANFSTLQDNPHFLDVGQELNILPVEGTYHRWSAGEGLNGVALGYGVTPEDIINWPGNNLDPETLGDWANPNIEPGTWLVVPGGRREYVSITPFISRKDPAVARHIGPGSCGSIYDGPVGFGNFIWPSGRQYLSGYTFSPATNHYGIDIAGRLGEPMWASDAGVVVYAGWNNFGYGNMVVIDHGNGWQTLYAHMSAVSAVCGQHVFQGTPIGSIGSTGKSSGPHIHYEMSHQSYGRVNPLDFLP